MHEAALATKSTIGSLSSKGENRCNLINPPSGLQSPTVLIDFPRPHLAKGRQVAMTPDERERMAILCERIAKEQNPQKFTQFVEQLNALLKAKGRRLEVWRKAKPN
jgi:hypothetical protein